MIAESQDPKISRPGGAAVIPILQLVHEFLEDLMSITPPKDKLFSIDALAPHVDRVRRALVPFAKLSEWIEKSDTSNDVKFTKYIKEALGSGTESEARDREELEAALRNLRSEIRRQTDEQ